MFQTVRHWWGNGRGKVTLRLFLFEFVVVVAGVLVAQGLATYVQDRSDLARMEAERSRLRYELTDAHAVFQEWRAAVPCLDQRMNEVMHGKEFAPNELRRPGFVKSDVAAPSNETFELIARRHGMQEKTSLNWILVNIEAIEPSSAKIREQWALLSLIDPVNGPPTASNRAEARVAAAAIKSELERIGGLSAVMEPLFQKLGIKAQEIYTPDRGPAKSCAAIWKSGRINPPLSMR